MNEKDTPQEAVAAAWLDRRGLLFSCGKFHAASRNGYLILAVEGEGCIRVDISVWDHLPYEQFCIGLVADGGFTSPTVEQLASIVAEAFAMICTPLFTPIKTLPIESEPKHITNENNTQNNS